MANTVFLNGRVLTMDAGHPEVEAVAVAGDRILVVGSDNEVRAAAGAGAEIVDLRGRTVLPGFIDSHCHLSRYGLGQLGLDCKARGVRSIDDLQRELIKVAETLPAGTWIRARGYDHTGWRSGATRPAGTSTPPRRTTRSTWSGPAATSALLTAWRYGWPASPIRRPIHPLVSSSGATAG